MTIPAADQSRLGKTVGELMGKDVVILEDGSTVGTFPYVTEYKEYSSNTDEQEGHYLALDLGEQYDGQEIGVKRNDQEAPKKETDTQWVLRIPNKETTFEITANDTPVLTLSFKGAAFAEKGGA